MTQEEKTLLEERIVDVLKTVYDPEIPVNIYDLGMIYKIDVQEDSTVELEMTFTAPNCPAADYILEDDKNVGKKVRNDATYNKDYLTGRYGAIPVLEEFDINYEK